MWAQPVIEKLDLNAVGFVTKSSNWFPADDLAAAFAAAQPFLAGFEDRIGYGYSQGGYAAIKASRPLALTRTIAVSPQWSIDPADILDDRYNRFFDADANRGMAITGEDAPSSLFVLYDRALPIDDRHVERILSAALEATVIPVPFTSHETVRAIRGTEEFRSLLGSFADGSTVATVSRLRRASAIRYETMIYRALQRRAFERASKILEAAPIPNDSRTTAYLWFGQCGGADAVLRGSMRHAVERPKDAMAWAVFGYVLAKLGKPVRARDAATRALQMSAGQRVRRLAEKAIVLCDDGRIGDFE